MAYKTGNLSGGQFLTELMGKDPRMAAFMQTIIDGVNNVAKAMAVGGAGHIAAPPPPGSVSVKSSGEMVHVSISHPGAIQRNIRYFTEVGVNDSRFTRPLVIDHGSSRASHPFTLPTKDDGGVPINYFFRSYAQYPGSLRSEFAYHGSKGAPTAVTMAGNTSMTPLPSTGSGTASNLGTQAGQGLGNVQDRPAMGTAKRSIGQ
jgi:hypothetical protein